MMGYKAVKTALFVFLAVVLFSGALFAGGANARDPAAHGAEPKPVVIGLDADMTSGSAKAGEAIRRGAVLAINEINRAGGVLGRPLKLMVRDHRGNPARGLDNIEEFAATDDLVAVIGGLHTPVALYELDSIHKHRIIYLDPWAAGTPVIANGRDPNYAFRVSVRDEYAGAFLIGKALRRGYRRPGLLLERTGWGRSNHRAMTDALATHGLTPAAVQWFFWGAEEMDDGVDALQAAGADVIMLVANAPEGLALLRTMASRPPEKRLPVIAHWGITGGDFHTQAGDALKKVDLIFLQTFSFLDPPFPARAERFIDAYRKAFPESETARDIFAPVGTAHAYDLVHLLARAIAEAATIDRPAVRVALENLSRYEGLVRNYDPPFTRANHDALTADDFRLARYAPDGAIVPVKSQ